MISAPVFCRRFIGREQQVSLLSDRFKAATKGEGSVVLVAGESGMGKTRLVTEYRQRVEKTGGQTAVGCCLEYAESPLAPFLDALRDLIPGNADAARVSQSVAATLTHLLPDLHGPVTSPTAEHSSDKLRQFRDITRFLAESAKSRPTVIVIEDLHWADDASLELLRYLLANSAASRLVVVATYRPEELRREHPLRTTLARMERSPSLWRIQLEPLADNEMRLLILDAVENRSPLPLDQFEDVRSRAEGNPLVAEELLKNAFELAASGKGGERLPLSVREAVAERLAMLTAQEAYVLACAASIGRRFELEFLAEIAECPLDEITNLMRRAINAQLLVEEAGPVVRYAFRHAITRDAVHEQLLASESRKLHECIALKLEAMPPTRERVAELAFQWWEAGHSVKAAYYNELAGDAARRVYAATDAAACYQRALDSGTYQGRQRAELLVKLGDACHEGGLTERARGALESAGAYFEAAGDVDNSARTYVLLSNVSWTLGDADALVLMSKRAVALVGANPESPVFFAAHLALAKAHLIAWFDFEKSLDYFAQAERAPHPWPAQGESNFFGYRALAHLWLGEVDRAISDRDRALDAIRRDDDWEMAVTVWANFGFGAMNFGERDLALNAFEQSTAWVRDKGRRVTWMMLQYAIVLLRFGQLEHCRRLVEQALPGCFESYRMGILAAQAGIGVGLQLEDADLVRRCAQADLLDIAFRSSGLVVTRAGAAFVELYLAEGRVDEARALLRRTIETLAGFKSGLTSEENWIYILAAAYADADVVSEARDLLHKAAARSKFRAMPAFVTMFDAHDARRSGDRDRARTLALEAATLFGSMQWPYCEAHAFEVAGLPARALEIYQRIGDLRDARRLEIELTPVNRRGQPKTALTQREREIAALAASGKSNREIGDALYISERTVETHIASIFGKLGLSNRAQLASRLATAQQSPETASRPT